MAGTDELLSGLSTDAKIAVLAANVSNLTTTVGELRDDFKTIIDNSNKAKGAAQVWNKLGTFLISIIGGGGAEVAISMSKNAASATGHGP